MKSLCVTVSLPHSVSLTRFITHVCLQYIAHMCTCSSSWSRFFTLQPSTRHIASPMRCLRYCTRAIHIDRETTPATVLIHQTQDVTGTDEARAAHRQRFLQGLAEDATFEGVKEFAHELDIASDEQWRAHVRRVPACKRVYAYMQRQGLTSEQLFPK